MDKEILQALLNVPSGEKAALATIISTKGSTPRQKGVSFLVFADGRTVGTIGGGCGEAEVKQAALMALDAGALKVHHVDLTAAIAAEEGMLCGGHMEVAIEPVLDPEPFRLIAAHQKKNETVYSCLAVEGDARVIGKRGVYDARGSFLGGTPVVERLAPEWLGEVPLLVPREDGRVFIQPVTPPHVLLVLGGGYIAQALVAMARQLDFEITVVDDRPDFANNRLFPDAQVICERFEKALKEYPITSSTYIVVVTRGHRYDAECLRQVVSSPAAYIGLIGSRRRTKLLFDQLAEEGYAREDLARVKTPIGLDIGGETPAEIAVSILAEIIWYRRKGKKMSKC
ncbi:MAG TPA: XdhC family protein [Clostridia bacterium]|nr:XdhC family protein [Clostridia bacterium]